MHKKKAISKGDLTNMKKCALHNLGCKVNSYETQAMQQMMEDAGYDIVSFGNEAADIYIINTCSVTNMADRKSRQMIHKARKLNKDAIIVATGCYVEAAKNMFDDDIDIIIGNNEKSRLLDIIEAYYNHIEADGKEDIAKVCSFDEMKINGPSEHTRAYVKIQDGCNRFCSYCIIPYVRGRIRSRNEEDVIEEILRIAESGCKEVVLTGIHLSSYGLDCPEDGITLIDIIEKINGIGGIERIRLGSLEPMIVTEEFTERLSKCHKVCAHFHLSLQSGCNDTLKRMNRRYTVEEFRNCVDILRRYFDNPAITTDVIVGFPGETEEEFADTERFLEDIRFYEMHIFKYSRRKGTVADRMPNQISEDVKTVRSNILLEMDSRLTEAYRNSYIGRTVKVLLEENQLIDGKQYIIGFTDTYVRVALENNMDKYVPNSIINVKITDSHIKDMVIGVAEI